MRLTRHHGHGLFVLSLSVPGATVALSCWTGAIARPMQWCFGVTRVRGGGAVSVGPAQFSWRWH
jgi:hypothetical protein